MPAQNSTFGLLLVGGVAIAAAVFGVLNWHWLEQRHVLETTGVPAIATIEAVMISHKACNSSVQVRWADAKALPHRGHLMTCFANRSPGDQIKVRYLSDNPDIAMIETGEGGLADDQFYRGAWIGALVAMVMALVTLRLVAARRLSN